MRKTVLYFCFSLCSFWASGQCTAADGSQFLQCLFDNEMIIDINGDFSVTGSFDLRCVTVNLGNHDIIFNTNDNVGILVDSKTNFTGTGSITILGAQFGDGGTGGTLAELNIGMDNCLPPSGAVECTLEAVVNILPVSLVYFEGEFRAEEVYLEWETAQEFANDYFEVFHSTDGRNFSSIGKVLGAGDSAESVNYSFVHTNPVRRTNYYRLRQYDFSGAFYDLTTIVVKTESGNEKLQIWPTVTHPGGQVYFEAEGWSDLSVQFYLSSTTGVYQSIAQTDQQSISLPTDLAPGLYYVEVIDGRERLIAPLVIR